MILLPLALATATEDGVCVNDVTQDLNCNTIDVSDELPETSPTPFVRPP